MISKNETGRNNANMLNVAKALRESNLNNPLESSANNFYQKSKRQKRNLIKEANSNEEKGSSSNSRNDVVDP